MNNKSRMYLQSLVEDFVLFVLLSQGIYTITAFFSIINNQKNGDDTIIAGQIITIFMINWIIAHP